MTESYGTLLDAAMGGHRNIHELLADARAGLLRLEPEDALWATRRGAVIVDIRSEHERAADGLVPGALFVPRSVLEWRVDPASGYADPALTAAVGPLVLMCAEGYSSSLAAATLQILGRSDATDMVGGFAAWLAAGLPVVRAGPWGAL